MLKEGIDNALDAEKLMFAPLLTVIVEADKIIFRDNAGGIDTATINSVLDYTVRVSTRSLSRPATRRAGQCTQDHPGDEPTCSRAPAATRSG